MGEIWKTIAENKNYQVSNLGRVRSLDRPGNNNSIKGKVLKPSDNKGYLRVSLYKNGKSNNWQYVHRLVASAFISNPENKPQVNHKNFCKSDNCIENLEWATKQEDATHLANSGRIAGENSSRVKLNWAKVNKVREEYLNNTKNSCLTLAKKYNISKSVITQIIHNEIWTDKNYSDVINSDKFKERLKNATNKGELNYQCKLSENQILEIRKRSKNGENSCNLAREFNVSERHIRLIIGRGCWKHI